MTRLEWLRYVKGRYEEKGIGEAEAEPRHLIADILDIEISDIFTKGYEPVGKEQGKQIEAALTRREQGEPLAYITGKRWFMGMEFAVDRRVLIPRQETELLAEEAITLAGTDSRILDLCTGSGCVAVSVALKTGAEVTASDISKDARETAKKNADRYGVQIRFVESDLFCGIQGAFHVITANPPYIDAEQMKKLDVQVEAYEPHLALFGGVDGLDFYRRIVPQALAALERGGVLLMEIGWDQGEPVRKMMEAYGYREIEIKKDYAGLDRLVKGVKADV